jgi:chromosome segregation ATPase
MLAAVLVLLIIIVVFAATYVYIKRKPTPGTSASTLEADLLEANRIRMEAEVEIATLKAQLDNITSSSGETLSSLKTQLDIQKGIVANLSGTISIQEGDIDKLNEDKSTKESTIAKLEKLLKEKTGSDSALIEQLNSQEAKILSLETKISTHDEKIEELKEAAETEKQRIINDLNEEITQKEKQIEDLDDEIALYKSKMGQLKVDVAEKITSIESLEGDILAKDDEIRRIGSQISGYERQIDILKQSADSQDELSKTLEEYSSTISRLEQAEIDNLAAIKQLNKEKSDLDSAMKALEEVVRSHNQTIDAYKKTQIGFKNTIDLRDKTIKDQSNALKELEGVLFTRNEDIKRLNNEVELRNERITSLEQSEKDQQDIINTLNQQIEDSKDAVPPAVAEALTIAEQQVVELEGIIAEMEADTTVSDLEERISTIEKDSARQIEELVASHEIKMAKSQADIDALQTSIGQLNDLVSDRNKAIKEMSAIHATESLEIQSAYDAAVSEILHAQELSISEMRELYDSQIASANKALEGQLAILSDVEDRDQIIAENIRNNEELRRQLNEDIAAARLEYSEMIQAKESAYRENLAAVEERHAGILRNIQDGYAGRINELENLSEEYKEKITKISESVNVHLSTIQTYEGEIRTLQLSETALKSELETAKQSLIEARLLAETQRKSEQATVNNLLEEKNKLKLAIDDMEAALDANDSTANTYKQQYENELERIKELERAQSSSLDTKFNDASSAISRGFERDIEDLSYDLKMDLRGAASQEERDQINQTFEQAMEDRANRYNADIARLKTDYQIELEKIDDNLLRQFHESAMNHRNAIMELQRESTSKIIRLNATVTQLSATSEAIQKSINLQLDKAQNAYDAEKLLSKQYLEDYNRVNNQLGIARGQLDAEIKAHGQTQTRYNERGVTIETHLGTIESLEGDIENLELEIETLKELDRTNFNTIEGHKQTITTLTNERNANKQMYEAEVKVHNELKTAHKDLTELYNKCNTERSTCRSEIEGLNKLLGVQTDLATEMGECCGTKTLEASQCNVALTAANSAKTSFENSAREWERKYTNESQSFSDARQAWIDKEKDINLARNAAEKALKTDLNSMTSERNQYKGLYEVEETAHGALKTNYNTLSDAHDMLGTDYNTCTDDLGSCRTLSAVEKKCCDDKTEELDICSKSLDDTRTARDTHAANYEAEVQKYEYLSKKYNDAIESWKNERATLEGSVSTEKSRYNQCNTSYTNITNQYNALQSEYNRMRPRFNHITNWMNSRESPNNLTLLYRGHSRWGGHGYNKSTAPNRTADDTTFYTDISGVPSQYTGTPGSGSSGNAVAWQPLCYLYRYQASNTLPLYRIYVSGAKDTGPYMPGIYDFNHSKSSENKTFVGYISQVRKPGMVELRAEWTNHDNQNDTTVFLYDISNNFTDPGHPVWYARDGHRTIASNSKIARLGYVYPYGYYNYGSW